MKRNLFIRADGGTSLGMGHVIRCLALASILKDDFNIIFAIQKPDNQILISIHSEASIIIHLPSTTDYSIDAQNFSEFLNTGDLVVLDGYNFNTGYQMHLKSKNIKLIAIDDLHAWHQVADVVINHASSTEDKYYSIEKYTKLYTGLKYVLLRKEFYKPKNNGRHIEKVSKIFISMGAADINNLTSKFVQALSGHNEITEIHLMTGRINPHLNKLNELAKEFSSFKIIIHFNLAVQQLIKHLMECDLCICPASTISLEGCAIGIPIISGYSAENQKANLKNLENSGCLINLGDMNLLTISEIKSLLNRHLSNIEVLNNLIKNQQMIIDGKSPSNILEIFKQL